MNYLLIEGNTFHDSPSGHTHFAQIGGTNGCAGPNTVILRGNTIYNIGSSSFIGGDSSESEASYLKYYNNTSFEGAVASSGGTHVTVSLTGGPGGSADHGSVFNNIFFDAIDVNPPNRAYFLGPDPVDSGADYNLGFLTGNTSATWSPSISDEANAILNQDPLFADSSSGNFTLQSGSPAIDAGGGLTLVHATDIGSGTSLVLEDAHFFQPGWGGTEADAIAVGTLDNTVQITSIDYDTDTITLANTISRNDGDPVWLFKDSRETPVLLGCAPDIGALESPADAAPRVCSIERQTPAGATTNADSVTFRVKFDETVVNVDAADFALSGTSAGDGTIGAVGVQSGRVYDVPVSGLGDSNGTLNLDLAGVQNIAGALGNPLTDLTPTVTEEEYTLDNDSPVISSVTSINVTETSADIQWSTNEAADSQVEYGLTTTYGTTTPLDASLGTSHSENLSGLSPNTLDHYRVLSRDALGNLAVSADFTVSTDITPPTVAITFPLDGATVTGTIVISGTAFDNTALSVVDVQIDGGAFDPAVGLDSWTFSLDTTALSEGIHTVTSRATDTGGNTTTDSISIDVNDTKSPSVTALNPLDGAVDVAIDAILALTFDEPVAAGIGNIEIRESIGDALFETIDVTSGQVIIVDDTVTVDPAGTLAHAAGYYLLVDAGAFTDLATNDFPGIGDATGWNFATVVDTTQPSVTALNPADDAVDVAIDTNLALTFDEPVAAGAGAIEIRETVGDALFESIDITSGQVTVVGTTVTVDPAGTLAPLTGYYVLMDAGAITDQASTPNEFAGIADTTAWSITIIAAPSPPTITGLAPTDDAVDVAIDATFVMTFDEPVAAGAGNIEIRETVGDALFESIDSTSGQVTVVGNTVTVDPAGTLTPLTGYYLLIDAGAITDQEANQADFAGIGDTTTWNFMTGEETTPPTITGLAPADDAVHVAIDATFVMTFDEPVAAGAGNIEIRETVGDALFESIDSTSGQVTVVGTTVTVDPAGTLAPLTGYYVLMDAGAITDQANTPNEFAGIADTTAWSITTASTGFGDQLQGLWKLDDGSGGTALDSSGNANHGTLNGDFLWTTEGIGGSLNLDGDGDYVTVGVGSQYSDLCINGCSFGGWIKPNGQPAASRTYGIIGRYDYTDADMFFRLAYNRWGRLFAFISYDGTITNRCRAISGYDFAFDRWQHVFVVFDGSTLKLYLDGVEEGSADCGFVGIDAAAWQDSESTFLGAFDTSDLQGEINAALDEIAMFNRALSPAELLDIYTNGVDAAP